MAQDDDRVSLPGENDEDGGRGDGDGNNPFRRLGGNDEDGGRGDGDDANPFRRLVRS